MSRPDGTTRFLDDVNATPLGTIGKNYRDRATPTRSDGALLVLYTDGSIERRDRLIDEGLDVARRARVDGTRNEPLDDALCDTLVDRSVRRPHPSPDDICVLALRVDPRTLDRCPILAVDIGGTKLAAGLVSKPDELARAP